MLLELERLLIGTDSKWDRIIETQDRVVLSLVLTKHSSIVVYLVSNKMVEHRHLSLGNHLCLVRDTNLEALTSRISILLVILTSVEHD